MPPADPTTDPTTTDPAPDQPIVAAADSPASTPSGPRRRVSLRRVVPALLVAAMSLFVALGLDVGTASTAAATPAQDVPPPATDDDGGGGCGSIPVISDACEQLVGGAVWATCPLGGVGDCTADLTQSVVSGAFDYFALWVATGAIGAIDMVWDGIDGTTTPTIDQSSSIFQTSMDAARTLALPLLVLAALYSLVKRDAEIAVKSALLYLPGSVVAMVLAGYVINALLAATDELSRSYVSGGETDIAGWLTDLTGLIQGGVGVAAPLLLVVFSFVLIVGSILVWLVMIVRSAAILVTYAFMPLALAAMIFPATRGWIRRIVEIQLSFILAKPVIVAVIAIGASTLNDTDNALVGMIHASALFYLAAFSPFALMKLLPFVADEAVAASYEHPTQTSSRVVSTTVGVVSGQKLAGFLAGSQQGGPGAISASASKDTLAGGSAGGGGALSGSGGSNGGPSSNGGSSHRGPGPSADVSPSVGAAGGGLEGGDARPATSGRDFT